MYVRFGEPLDVTGNVVNDDGVSLDPNGHTIDRKDYVCNRYEVVQRDRNAIVPIRSGRANIESLLSDNIVLSTRHCFCRMVFAFAHVPAMQTMYKSQC